MADPQQGAFFRPGDGNVQLSAQAIHSRVQELGRSIRQDYQHYPEEERLHLVCVLNGAFMFMADLVRAIELPLSVDFLAVSSYGDSTKSSGEVRLVKDLDQSLEGKHVILVEDIVDTGLTMDYLLDYLRGREPLSLKIAALLAKPSRAKIDIHVDYLGFDIDDAFVYGYGLDIAHLYRNLPFITSQKS